MKKTHLLWLLALTMAVPTLWAGTAQAQSCLTASGLFATAGSPQCTNTFATSSGTNISPTLTPPQQQQAQQQSQEVVVKRASDTSPSGSATAAATASATASPGSGGGRTRLPRTGSSTGWLLGSATVLLVLGWVFVSEAGARLRRRFSPVAADPVSEAHWDVLGWSRPFGD